VHQAFNLDILVTIEDCRRLYSDWDTFGDELQHIIANMMFNLGYPRLERFRNMREAVNEKDYEKAADEMIDSKWYTQVPNRAERLVKRMRELADG
jgi:lysozyme